MYRNPKYIKHLISQPSDAPPKFSCPKGDRIPAHQRNMGHCGEALKPPDTYALCLYYFEHAGEHRGDKTFWGNTDRAKLCVKHVVKYLDEVHNIDGWRLVLEKLTQHMEENGL